MALNNRGWTAIQDGNATPRKQDAIGTLLNGRDAIVIDGVQVDLGTLGGKNSFMNWGEINDWGQKWAIPKRMPWTRTAKAFADSAPTLRVARFCGKTST